MYPMDESELEGLRETILEAQIKVAEANLAKKGATRDEIDDYIYSLRTIEELNNKYFAKG